MRYRGALQPHAAEDWSRVGDAFCLYGLVETTRWPEDGKGARCLVVRIGQTFQSHPPRLYQPTLVRLAQGFIHFRGFESTFLQDGAAAAVVQEWAIFPKLQPEG